MFQLHSDYSRGYSYSSFYPLHLYSFVQVTSYFHFLLKGFEIDIDYCRLRCVIVKLTQVGDSNKTSCDIELREVESNLKLLRTWYWICIYFSQTNIWLYTFYIDVCIPSFHNWNKLLVKWCDLCLAVWRPAVRGIDDNVINQSGDHVNYRIPPLIGQRRGVWHWNQETAQIQKTSGNGGRWDGSHDIFPLSLNSLNPFDAFLEGS